MRQGEVAGDGMNQIQLGVGFEAVGAGAAQVGAELLGLAGLAAGHRLPDGADAVFVVQEKVAYIEAQPVFVVAAVANFGRVAAGVAQVGVDDVSRGRGHQVAEQHRPEGPRVVGVEVGAGRHLELGAETVEQHMAAAGLVGQAVFGAAGRAAQVALAGVAQVVVAQARRDAQAGAGAQQYLGKGGAVGGGEVELVRVATLVAGQAQVKAGAGAAHAALLAPGAGAVGPQAAGQRVGLAQQGEVLGQAQLGAEVAVGVAVHLPGGVLQGLRADAVPDKLVFRIRQAGHEAHAVALGHQAEGCKAQAGGTFVGEVVQREGPQQPGRAEPVAAAVALAAVLGELRVGEAAGLLQAVGEVADFGAQREALGQGYLHAAVQVVDAELVVGPPAVALAVVVVAVVIYPAHRAAYGVVRV